MILVVLAIGVTRVYIVFGMVQATVCGVTYSLENLKAYVVYRTETICGSKHGFIVSTVSLSLCAACFSSPVAPNVTKFSVDQTLTSLAPVSFSCTVDSYPTSNITWLHNGAVIQAEPPRVTISTVQVDNRTQESTLTLLNTTSVDIGNYTCSAENDEGSTSLTTELQVLSEFQLLVPFTFSSLFSKRLSSLLSAYMHSCS